MKLDIVVATHNRASALTRLLESLRDATCPTGLDVTTIVVDNHSSDGTRDVVLSAPAIHGNPPVYAFEPVLGHASALNHGLRLATGDLVGRLDDDERVAPDWLITVRDMFQDPSVGFISGPYKPDWGAPAPNWLPKAYPAVIGWIEAGDNVLQYGENYDGTMMGGNAIIRGEWVKRVGLFDVDLGRKGQQLTTGEDADYHERLLASGARGLYVPSLVIYHNIPAGRLTKRYYRRWCFFRGISLARMDRVRPQAVKRVFGVPRYLFGSAAQSLLYFARTVWRRDRDPEQMFTAELRLWDLLGFMFGRFFRSGAKAIAVTAPARAEDDAQCA